MISNLKLVIIIPSVLSIFGCLFILLSYFTFKKLRSSVGVFVLWFAISGLGNSLYPFFGSPPDHSFLCKLQSIVGTYFLLSNVLTSTILSHLLYSIFYIPSFPMTKINWSHYLYSWGIPIIFVCIPLITSSYGKDGESFCWIESKQGDDLLGVFMQFLVLYGPMWACIIFDLIAYGFIWKKQRLMIPNLDQSLLSSSQNRVMRLTRYMIGYPLVTVFCWTLPTIQRLGDLLQWDSQQFSSASDVTVYIQGFLVFLIYCKTSPALKLWKRVIQQKLFLSQSTSSSTSNLFISNHQLSHLQHQQHHQHPQQQSAGTIPPISSYPSMMSSLQQRLYTTDTNSTDLNSRVIFFSTSNSLDYGDEDDAPIDEEYEGHRFQNTIQNRQRWLDNSWNIPPISEDGR